MCAIYNFQPAMFLYRMDRGPLVDRWQLKLSALLGILRTDLVPL